MSDIPSFKDQFVDLDQEPPVARPVVDPNSPAERLIVEELSAATGADPYEIETARINQDFSHTEAAKNSPDFEGYVELLRNSGVPLEEATERARTFINKKSQLLTPTEFMFKSALIIDDETINEDMYNFLINWESANTYVASRLEEELGQSSVAGGIAGWFEVNVGRIVINIWDDLNKRANKEGGEYLINMMNSPTEFQEYFRTEVEERMDEGFIAGIGEAANLRKTQADLQNMGDDPQAAMWQTLAAVDLATLGLATPIKNAVLKLPSKAILASKSVTDAIALARGIKEAGEHVVKVMDEGTASALTPNRAAPASLDPTDIGAPRPSAATVVVGTRPSIIFERLEKDLYNAGVLGRRVTPEAVREAADIISDRIVKSANNNVVSIVKPTLRNEGSDNYVVKVVLGKDGGDAFDTAEEARAFANNNPEFKVVEAPRVVRDDTGEYVERLLDVPEGTRATVRPKGFFLEYEERVNVRGLAPELEDLNLQEGVVRSAFAKVFASPVTGLGKRVSSMITRAEAALGRANEFSTPFVKKLKKLDTVSLQSLDRVFTSFRDGEHSYLREAPTVQKFEQIYKEVNQAIPSQEVKDAYIALLDIGNSSWHVAADNALKDVVDRGGRMVTMADDFETIAFRSNIELTDKDYVWDATASRPIPASEVGDNIVYQLSEPFADDYIFAINPRDTRIVQKTDAMGYNVGGPRDYTDTNWFIGVVEKRTVAGGREVSTGLKALLGTFSEKQALKAEGELNNLVTALKPYLDNGSLFSLNFTKQARADLKEVILKNNSWKKDVTDIDSLIKVAKDYNLSFKQKFVRKSRDEPASSEDLGLLARGPSIPVSKIVQLRTSRMKRKDTPIMQYGGAKATSASPIQNIMQQFDSSTYGYLHRQSNDAAAEGWVKAAEKTGVITFPKGVAPSDFKRMVLEAQVPVRGGGLVQQLADQQTILRSRLGGETGIVNLDRFYNRMGEAIFDKLGWKTDPSKAADTVSNTAMTTAFRLKMSFFNHDQFFLQAMHVSNIMFISPLRGTQAATLYPVMRTLLATTGETRELLIKRMVKLDYVSEKDIRDTLRYLEESGRSKIEATIIERQGAGSGTYIPTTRAGKVKAGFVKVADKSSFFFNEGEMVTRIVSATTAILEHNAKNIGDAFSDKGRILVSDREQALSFRMTASQKGAYQQGNVLRVATQWLTYSNRFLENLVLGRDFTRKERGRMAAGNLLMFGTVATGVGSATSKVFEALGYEATDPEVVKLHNNVKFGLFDNLLSAVVGEDVSYGTRAAPMAQFYQTYQELFMEKNVAAALGGPSAEIVSDGLKLVPRMLNAVFIDETYEVFKEDLQQFLRNVKSVDTYAKIKDIVERGEYRSKSKGPAVAEVKPEAAFGVFLGGTPMAAINYYDARDIIYKENETFKRERRYLKAKRDIAMDLIRSGNPAKMERGMQLYEDVKVLVYASPFSEELKQSLRRSLIKEQHVYDMLEAARKLGNASQIATAAALNSNVGE